MKECADTARTGCAAAGPQDTSPEQDEVGQRAAGEQVSNQITQHLVNHSEEFGFCPENSVNHGGILSREVTRSRAATGEAALAVREERTGTWCEARLLAGKGSPGMKMKIYLTLLVVLFPSQEEARFKSIPCNIHLEISKNSVLSCSGCAYKSKNKGVVDVLMCICHTSCSGG